MEPERKGAKGGSHTIEVGKKPEAGNADTARLRAPAASALNGRRDLPHALTLPAFHPSIPALYVADSADDVAGSMAEALLSEGVLCQSDYDRDRGLVGSLSSGLKRWANTLLGAGCEEMTYFTLKLAFTNSLGEWGVEGTEADWGGFGLMHQEQIETVKVGGRVTELNAWTRSAGWSVMDVLTGALHITASAATPSFAEDWMNIWWEGRDTSPKKRAFYDEGLIRPKQFYATCPKRACCPIWNAKAMTLAVKRSLGLPRNDWRRSAVELTLQIREELEAWKAACEATKRKRNEMWQIGVLDHFPGVCVRWSEKDEIVRILDDVGEQIWQIEHTNAVWIAGFQPGSLEGIQQAARSLSYCLKILGLCDILLGLLDSPDTLPEVFQAEAARQRVRG